MLLGLSGEEGGVCYLVLSLQVPISAKGGWRCPTRVVCLRDLGQQCPPAATAASVELHPSIASRLSAFCFKRALWYGLGEWCLSFTPAGALMTWLVSVTRDLLSMWCRLGSASPFD